MALSVRYNGVTYKNVVQASVKRSIGALSGEASITTSADENQALPVKKGVLVEVLADESPICTGYIDKISGSYTGTSHTLTFTVRDKTADLVDSCLKGKKDFAAGINLVSIIQRILSDQGLSDIKVKNQAGTLAAYKDGSSAQIGQKIFEFLENLARKSQVLLTTDGLGNVVITRGQTTSSGLLLINKIGDPLKRNNILASDFETDDSGRYHSYVTHTHKSPLLSLKTETPERLNGIAGSATDDDIRSSRYLEYFAEEQMTDEEIKQRAGWEANIRRAKSLKYSATVQGHTINGTPWDFNKIVRVQDEFWNIDADLLITDIEFQYSLETASTTHIELTYPDSFIPQSYINAARKHTQKIAEKFTVEGL